MDRLIVYSGRILAVIACTVLMHAIPHVASANWNNSCHHPVTKENYETSSEYKVFNTKLGKICLELISNKIRGYTRYEHPYYFFIPNHLSNTEEVVKLYETLDDDIIKKSRRSLIVLRFAIAYPSPPEIQLTFYDPLGGTRISNDYDIKVWHTGLKAGIIFPSDGLWDQTLHNSGLETYEIAELTKTQLEILTELSVADEAYISFGHMIDLKLHEGEKTLLRDMLHLWENHRDEIRYEFE